VSKQFGGVIAARQSFLTLTQRKGYSFGQTTDVAASSHPRDKTDDEHDEQKEKKKKDQRQISNEP